VNLRSTTRGGGTVAGGGCRVRGNSVNKKRKDGRKRGPVPLTRKGSDVRGGIR